MLLVRLHGLLCASLEDTQTSIKNQKKKKKKKKEPEVVWVKDPYAERS